MVFKKINVYRYTGEVVLSRAEEVLCSLLWNNSFRFPFQGIINGVWMLYFIKFNYHLCVEN